MGSDGFQNFAYSSTITFITHDFDFNLGPLLALLRAAPDSTWKSALAVLGRPEEVVLGNNWAWLYAGQVPSLQSSGHPPLFDFLKMTISAVLDLC